MTDQLISFETAKLAKEKGFNIECIYHIEKNLKTEEILNHVHYGYECPTQSLLQKWIRETHSIHIGIDYDVGGWSYFYLTNLKSPTKDVNWSKNYDTYEETLEAGLQEALKLI